MMMITMMFGTM